MLVREVMTQDVVTVGPEATVKQAIRLLKEHRITAMPVVDPARRLVGVISEADVLRDAVPADRRVHERLVEITGWTARLAVTDVMTHLTVSVDPDEDLTRAVDLFVDTQVKSLPVVRKDRVVGVISRSDVIGLVARHDDLIEAEVDEQLREAGYECTVSVDDGIVRLEDADGPGAMHIAMVIASRVPGVVA
jgi:CBS domain-containing protein